MNAHQYYLCAQRAWDIAIPPLRAHAAGLDVPPAELAKGRKARQLARYFGNKAKGMSGLSAIQLRELWGVSR